MANIPLRISVALASTQIPSIVLKLEAWLKVDRAANNGPSRSAERRVNTCIFLALFLIGLGVDLVCRICTTDSKNLWGLADGEEGTGVRSGGTSDNKRSSMFTFAGRTR